MSEAPRRGAVRTGTPHARRRPKSAEPRRHRVTAWYSDEELQAVLVFAAAARLAPAAYVAMASLRPSAWQVGAALQRVDEPAPAAVDGTGSAPVDLPGGAVLADPPDVDEQRRMLLLELMGIHRQLRGAATNLNQAVAKLNALGEPVGELPAVAAYVRGVATAADGAVAAVRMRR